jgi:hypothetical protein
MTCPNCNAPVALWELHYHKENHTETLTEFMWQCGGSREDPCTRPRPTIQELLTTGIQTYIIDMVGTIPVVAMNPIPVGRYSLPRFENLVVGWFQ